MSNPKPFWSDDFDMDLLKIFPDVPKMLRDPERKLWTVCENTTLGRINCPVMWNGPGSLLWLEKPNLIRDKDGWFNVHGLVSSAEEVECTWLEWLRDLWAHAHPAVILPVHLSLPCIDYNGSFYPIMSDLRGWYKQDVGPCRESAIRWIMRCDRILSKAIQLLAERLQKPDAQPDSGVFKEGAQS